MIMNPEILHRMLGLPEDVDIGWVRWDVGSGDLMVTFLSERWKDDPHVREITPVIQRMDDGGFQWSFDG